MIANLLWKFFSWYDCQLGLNFPILARLNVKLRRREDLWIWIHWYKQHHYTLSKAFMFFWFLRYWRTCIFGHSENNYFILILNSCFKKERNISVLILVLVIFPQSDEAFPLSLDIDQPKLKKQTKSPERMKKWRQNLNNKELENKKKRVKYYQNKATKKWMKEREKARICKALLRENQKEMLSCQKLQGLKIKERHRKWKECSGENFSSLWSVMHIPLFTQRVQKHRAKKNLLLT